MFRVHSRHPKADAGAGGATVDGPGARLDEMFSGIYSKIGLQPPRELEHFNGPGAEIDKEIRDLKSAVKVLQDKHEEMSKVRLHRLLERDMKAEEKLFDSKEDLLDRPRTPESVKPLLDHAPDDKLNRAIERALHGTQDALKEAILRGEKQLEESLRETQGVLLEGVQSLVDHMIHGGGLPELPVEDSAKKRQGEKPWV